MKKLFLGTILFALLCVFPVTTMAEVSVGIGISLPPIVIGGPPAVVALPDTNVVYVAPDISVDLFFWGGFWWRPYGGAWYRSPYYDRDWVYYNGVPSFYFTIDPYWRTYYHNHSWHGHNWNYQSIPYSHLQSSWRTWDRTRYWQDRKRWDVQDYRAKPQRQQQVLRKQRQGMYYSRPEVQQHQQFQRQQRQEQQRQPQMQQQRQPQRQQQYRDKPRPESPAREKGMGAEHGKGK